MNPLLLITIAQIVFYLSVIASTIYGLVFGYHWFAYGSSRHTNMVALGAYVVGICIFLLTMWLALHSLSSLYATG